MATVTLQYDGRSNVMKHLIKAMLAAGAIIQSTETKPHEEDLLTPSLRSKIKKAREESINGETIVCKSPVEMQQYFDSL